MSSTDNIWPSGDKVLVLNNGEINWTVSSHALRLASPVWNRMLDPDHADGISKEGLPETKEIPLPDDDPKALRIILDAAHLQFTNVPKQLDFPTLVKVAALCDKYDSAVIMKPFAKDWLSPHRHSVTARPEAVDLGCEYEGWLMVAWTLGIQAIFDAVSRQICVALEVKQEGTLWFCGRPLNMDYLPPSLDGKQCCDPHPRFQQLDCCTYKDAYHCEQTTSGKSVLRQFDNCSASAARNGIIFWNGTVQPTIAYCREINMRR